MATKNKQVLVSSQAPQALGPYSAGIRAGDYVYTSGQIGIDRSTGKLVTGGVEAQARQALTNLGYVLQAAGLSLAEVVKTTVFLTDMNDYAAVNAVYATFFSEAFPARSAIQVGALPGGALVEIEAVAFGPGA
jgi:2-iminobutanoate/2-iminopropanoate deaminase